MATSKTQTLTDYLAGLKTEDKPKGPVVLRWARNVASFEGLTKEPLVFSTKKWPVVLARLDAFNGGDWKAVKAAKRDPKIKPIDLLIASK